MQAFFFGERCAREVAGGQISNPHGRLFLPNVTRKANALLERLLLADFLKFTDGKSRHVPDFYAAQHVLLAVNTPERAEFPAQALADRLKNFRSGIPQPV